MDEYTELDDILNEHLGRASEDEPADAPHEAAVEADDSGDAWSDADVDPQLETCMYTATRMDEMFAADPPPDDEDHAQTTGDCEDFNIGDFTCKCSVNCVAQFEKSSVDAHILNVQEMTKDEKEMYIMGVLHEIGVDKHKTWRGERKRKRYGYTFEGKRICRQAFQFVYDIGRCSLTNIQTHININGKTPRVHGNKGRSPHHALRYAEVKHCTDFLVQYSEEHGLPQPAAPRGRDGLAPVYLPATLTKESLHKEYRSACEAKSIRCLGLTSFKGTWHQCLPHIKIATARDDVCHKCELIRKRITDAVTEEEKLNTTSEMNTHVQHAKKERELYKQSLDDARSETPAQIDRPAPPCSQNFHKIHYTFDYSQQVSLPHHYRQMGPLYFLSLRKVQIFGVRVDGIPQQYNYLVDEDQSIGPDGSQTHGPNAVISMLHHALTFYGCGEKGAVMHCDNCGGNHILKYGPPAEKKNPVTFDDIVLYGRQNKNKYMLAYLSWRTLVGLHDNITLLMQVPGHTRCLVDSGFAHIKRLYRRSDVESVAQLIDAVNKSATTNVAVPYMQDNGEETWQWRDWKTFLSERFVPLKGIQKYKHFTFNADTPGFVFLKKHVGDDEEKRLLMGRNVAVNAADRPRVLQPAGLSRERQRYLHKTVRPYVRPALQDSLCPVLQEE